MFELTGNDLKGASLQLTRDDLLIFCSSLNEVCNGIEIFEFQTRIGAERDEVKSVMKKIKNFVKQTPTEV